VRPGETPRAAAARSAFVDLLRAAAVVSIVFLHVTLANLARLPAGRAGDLYYDAATVLASIYSNETLVFISLLLALQRAAARDLGALLAARLLRIGIPFLVFTLLYVALDALWRREGVIFRFEPAEAAALLFVAGLGEYHLHFLPALLVLAAALPIFSVRLPLPAILVLLAAGALARYLVQAAVIGAGAVADLTAQQLLLLHLGKLLAYLPYGFLARWFVAESARLEAWRGRGAGARFPALLAVAALAALDLGLMTLLADGARLGWRTALFELLGAALAAAGIFLAFAWAPVLRRDGPRDAFASEFYSRAFLALMIHPLFLRLFNALVPAQAGDPLFDLLGVAFVLAASFLAAALPRWGLALARRV
jgi:surface polysaccharide O-acyltransferase-like enzyme